MNDRVKDSKHRQARAILFSPLREEFHLDMLFGRYEPHKALETPAAIATDTEADFAPLTQDAVETAVL